MSVTDTPTIIDAPGVYELSEDVYHADPVPGGSLSSSQAKRLMPPSCPARFKWELDHGRPHKPEFDFGSAAHKLVLGEGNELVVVDAKDWRTKDAQQQRDQAHADGKTPLLSKDMAKVEAMAEQLESHPAVKALFLEDFGFPEQSAFWIDQPSGLWRRARFDWLPEQVDGAHMRVPDYKTTVSAEPRELSKTLVRFGYHMQAAWYLDAVAALGLAESASFVFVFQEKEAPYVVTVVELDDDTVELGRRRNRQAIDLFLSCVESGRWPGYSDGPVSLSVPAWAFNDAEVTG